MIHKNVSEKNDSHNSFTKIIHKTKRTHKKRIHKKEFTKNDSQKMIHKTDSKK